MKKIYIKKTEDIELRIKQYLFIQIVRCTNIIIFSIILK